MAIEMLSYRQLGERLGCSRDAARELVKRLRLPRHMASDGKALVCIDLSEINHNPTPTQSPTSQLPVTASQECIEPKQAGTAASYQAALERERDRAERLMRGGYLSSKGNGGPARRRAGSVLYHRSRCDAVSAVA